jgi:uncharacterized protein (DUF1800 family)
MKKEQQLKHLLWRTGFGPDVQSIERWMALKPSEWWPAIKKDAAGEPEYFNVSGNALDGFAKGLGELGRMERDRLDKEQRKKLRKESRDGLRNLNMLWMEEMVRSKAQLREKLALFWHGHFASRQINMLYQQQLLHIIRRHALGNFGTLLREVSKSASMLAFLNNQQNRKRQPNENFAREVMELFTLGRGHYTEQDIKEAARAFTGWGFKPDGTFVFRENVHDFDEKTFLGKTGRFDGEDVLTILLDQPRTAFCITQKLYRFLVNEQVAPSERIEWLADRFYRSGYEMSRLLDDIFTSEWFYDEENQGANIKSPVDLWVGLRRGLCLEMGSLDGQVLLQRALGQVLFFPPNVAGWPGGRQWIDASTLMLRLRIPHILLDDRDPDIQTKGDDDTDMGMGQSLERRRNRLQARINWEPWMKRYGNIPENELLPTLSAFLWQTPQSKAPRAVLEKHTVGSNSNGKLKTTVIQLMATPEYQMC